MFAAQSVVGLPTRENLTDEQLEDEKTRAVDIVLGFAEAKLRPMNPEVRGFLTLALSHDYGRTTARNWVLEAFGYVSREPVTFVRFKLDGERYPTGLPGGRAS